MARRVVLSFAVLLVGLATAAFYYGYAAKPVEPPLSSKVQRQTIEVGEQERSYLLYVPANLPAAAPLVVIFHGASETAAMMRRFSTGYEFDRLADENKFVVVYADGYQRRWNDCRTAGNNPAREHKIDDVGLFNALVDRLHATLAIDPARVFAVGYSNGGHLAFRLALEEPQRVTAIAAFAANLETDDNLTCQLSGKPVPAMLVEGTADPLSPFEGGMVSLFGLANRGPVRSAHATAEYFAALAGLGTPETRKITAPEGLSDNTWVEQFDWQAPGKAQVLLDVVHGGGHVVPQPVFIAPRLFGPTTHAINGPAEAWRFFSHQPSLLR